jgi:hypothetical protein
VVEPEPTWNIPEVLAGLMQKKEAEYFKLDPEYRPNLDMLIFKTEIAYQQFIKKMQEEQMVNQLAQRAIMAGQQPQGGQPMGQPPMGVPQGAPQLAPVALNGPEAGNMPPQGM